MDRDIACIMDNVTYRSSSDGEPAKVFLGMIDSLLLIIILREKKDTNKAPTTFSLSSTVFAA